jgi:hypothetical protein
MGSRGLCLAGSGLVLLCISFSCDFFDGSFFFLSTSIIKVIRSLPAWHRSAMPCSRHFHDLNTHPIVSVCLQSRLFASTLHLHASCHPCGCSRTSSPAHMDINSHIRPPLPTHGPWRLSVRERVPSSVTHPSRTAGTPSKRRTRTTMVSEHFGRDPVANSGIRTSLVTQIHYPPLLIPPPSCRHAVVSVSSLPSASTATIPITSSAVRRLLPYIVPNSGTKSPDS